MTLDLLALAPIAVGHLALLVYVTNVVHALGRPEPVLNRIRLVLLALYALLTAGLAWEAWNGSLVALAWSWPGMAYGGVCLVVGLVVFPAVTAYLQHRPTPSGVSEVSTESDLAGPLEAGSLVGTGRYAWLLRLPGNQSFRLCKRELELTLPGLPAALDGLSLLHLSDLHLAPCFDRRYFDAVADEAAALTSDLVLFTGDLIDHEDAAGWVVPILSRVRGTLGSYGILGNHDVDHNPERLRRLIEEAGFVDLDGGWDTLAVGGKTLALGGTSYPWGPPLPLSGRPEADYHLLLSHTPDLFYWAERAGFDLMLSGHNHGGQIRFPLVGAVFMPSVYSRRFDRGFFRKNGLTLHVSQGVAGKHPVRYGCRPEIGRLVLRSAPAPAERRDAAHDGRARAHGHGVPLSEETPR